MSVDFPEDEPGEEERLPGDEEPTEDVTPEEKRGAGRPTGKGSAAHRASENLSATIWEEYAGGMNTREIGDLHGMTRQAVWARIRRYREKLGIEEIESAKALDLGRYEALIERVWSKTFQNPNPENVRSLAMLMDQRAKLLGLNAPKKLQVDGNMSITPPPEVIGFLTRLRQEQSMVQGEISRPEIEGPGDVVEAELVDDPD